ncbi:transporter substrate-binding domain-containing protein [Vibrio sp. JC009]|uniref:substrate-binding periplasmic protein n=1 Tax=Vibrio sp. JC009 TaxID=2912314 RepID=UPI0023B187DF|nr:transporter substrate-binding domain-containing protein [Vibrio sp. JC009]WED23947.1 transporter substrate-binding domain-containing protein [Vibrio sp. JC009]
MSGPKISVLSALCIGLLAHKASYAEEITIATGHLPPLYCEIAPDNGRVLNIVRAAFDAVGIQVNYDFMPWPRVNYHAKSGKKDASCCWFNQEERAEHALYSEGVYAYNYSFYYLKKTDFDWDSIEDLKGFQLGGTEGYSYTPEFTAAEKAGVINVKRTSSDLKNFRMLLAGRIDAFPVNVDYANYVLKTEMSPEDVHRFTHHPNPLRVDYVHLVFPKQNEKSARLQEAFDQGMQIIHANGVYKAIVARQ